MQHNAIFPTARNRFISLLSSLPFVLALGCGGGGGSSEPPFSVDTPTYTAGVYQSETQFKNLCQTPRNFTDINGDAYPDQQGSTLHENHWLRSWSNNTYLWYSELPDINPASDTNPVSYFNRLKTNAITNSGTPKDNFHFSMDTTEYEQSTQSGVSMSYGIEWKLTSSTPPRELFIRYLEPGSPAAAPAFNLKRGVQILEIDGVSVANGNTQSEINTLNAGLFPSTNGESHTFTVLDDGANQSRQVTLTATEVAFDPVPLVSTLPTANGNVGYILFQEHNFVSEDELFNAVTTLSTQNISDLVLDLRYNGGGFLYIASQLSYMIAGSTATANKTFEQIRFNDKHPTIDPVTRQTLAPTPFYTSVSQYSDQRTQGTPLPQLNLNRVFILSTDRTCSASEAIINGLRGIDVEVILVGDTTCGKPYGFYATDNCGTTYFTIQFDGINDKGIGGYSDGFSPMNTSGTVGYLVPGCNVEDDLSAALGDQTEPMLATALSYRTTGSCPVANQNKYSPTEHQFKSAGELEKNSPTLNFKEQKIYLSPYSE